MKFLAILALFLPSVMGLAAQTMRTADNKNAFAEFEARAKKYDKLRRKIATRLPSLPKDATPEQIAANKTALRSMLLRARIKARQGDLITHSANQLIREMIKREFTGYEAAEIRQSVWEIDPRGILTKINIPYPEAKEIVEMSPALLLMLPQLPKSLRYRYIGRNLAIIDRDTSLIIDFMRDALP